MWFLRARYKQITNVTYWRQKHMKVQNTL